MTWPNSLYPLGGAMGEEIEEPRIIETAVDSSSLKITIIWVHVRVHNMRKGSKLNISRPKMTILFKNLAFLFKTAIKNGHLSSKIAIL